MHLLSYSETHLVSGGKQSIEAFSANLLKNVKDYSFYSTIIGSGITAIYGICTWQHVITVSDALIVISPDFPQVFAAGMAVSWFTGLAAGFYVAAYQAFTQA
jgi:hypothetical protein